MEFKLKSKLSPTKYPCLTSLDEILKWLTFAPSIDYLDIDPVLLGRLAAMARDEGVVHYIISGNRSTTKQAEIYLSKGGVKNPDGTYSDPYKKINGKVAKPNTSDHEIHFAVDSGSKYYKSIETTEHPMEQHKFNKYGLCKPLTIGAGMKKCIEDWHIIPVEIWKLSRVDKVKIMATAIIKPQIDIYTKLSNAKILSSITYWKQCETGYPIEPQYVKTVIMNYYQYVVGTRNTLEESLNFVVKSKVISSPEYWLDCINNNVKVNGLYVKTLLENMAGTIK